MGELRLASDMRRVVVLSVLLGCLALLVHCVDLLTREPPEPPIVASVPPYGPWAGGPPILWGNVVVDLLNRSSEPALIEAFSIAGRSDLEHIEEQRRHLAIEGYASGLRIMLPVAAGAHAVDVQVRLQDSQRRLASDLQAQVEAGHWCTMIIVIEDDAVRATPCDRDRGIGSYILDD